MTRGAIEAADLLDVVAGFGIRGNAVVALDGAFAGIVGGEGEAFVLEKVLQILQIADAGFEVGGWVEGIGDPEPAGGGGDQLHQALSALGRDGVGVEVGFDGDDRADQVRVDFVTGGGLVDQLVELGGGFGGAGRPGR